MGRLAGQDLAKTPVDTITTKPDEDISDITLGDMPETKPVFADETALDVTVAGPRSLIWDRWQTLPPSLQISKNSGAQRRSN